jgi:hypothetical protein
LTSDVWTDAGVSIILTPGRWKIESFASMWIGGGNGTSINFRLGLFAITDNANTLITGVLCGAAESTKVVDICSPHISKVVDVTSPTTYKTRFTSTEDNTATTINTLQLFGSINYPITLYAVRITEPLSIEEIWWQLE